MNSLLPLATRELQQTGTFEPYGGYMRPDDSVAEVEVAAPMSESTAAELVETLRQRVRELAEQTEAKAAAIVVRIHVTPPGVGHRMNAIEILVEHRDSYCAQVFFPYQLKDGEITFGQMFAQGCGMHILG